MSAAGLSRRGVLLGAVAVCGCGAAHRAWGAEPSAEAAGLTAAPAVALSPAEEERHGVFLLLAMALLCDAWGVDRAEAARLAAYAEAAPGRRFAGYLGHNIGALLVDEHGAIKCFALNRSVALNSTLAHAEARAVGAAIEQANAQRAKPATPDWSFGALLRGDRLYGTLEPCAQCTGIIDLANLGAVIYAQDDPGQREIVNVVYNLHRRPGEPGAPLPIRATFLPFWDRLAAAYRQFVAAASPGSRTGLTSFLQTVEAYRIYETAARAFDTLRTAHPENSDTLREARAFRTRWADALRDDPLGLVPAPPASELCRGAANDVVRPAGPLGLPVCAAK